MSTDSSAPTAADLAALEHAFASDPSGDTWKRLADAYRQLGRFMEATVVCKRGIREHPSDPAGHLLLARIYADQGKDRKAVQELEGALEVDAGQPEALRLLGTRKLEQGDEAEGRALLTRAAQADPGDPDVRAALEKWGLPLPEVEAPPPPASPEPPPAPAPAPAEPQASASAEPHASSEPPRPAVPEPPPSPTEGLRPPPRDLTGAPPPAPRPGNGYEERRSPPVLDREPLPADPAPAPSQAARRAAGLSAEAAPSSGVSRPAVTREPEPPPARAPERPAPPPAAPAPVTSARRPAGAEPAAPAEPLDDDLPVPTRRKGGATTLVILALGLAALGGYFVWYNGEAAEKQEISDLLRTAGDELARDSYPAYAQAAETLQKILDLDPDQFAAHAYLAYISTLRWGEHGEGDTYRERAQQHIAAAEAHGQEHSHLIAAQAWHRYYSGEPAAAVAQLRAVLERPGVTSSLLAGALGTMMMNTGDYDGARKWLQTANHAAPGNPRILAALGELARREGEPRRSWNFFDQALNFDGTHVESLLGQALLILDSGIIEHGEAAPLVQKVLELPPGQVSPKQKAMAYFAEAQLAWAEGKASEARAAEEKALTLQPDNPDIHLMMGRRLARAGEQEKAAASIRRAVELEPGRVGFRVELARVLLDTPGGAAEAVEALEKAVAALPEDEHVRVLLGEAQAEAGRHEAAFATLEEAVRLGEEGRSPEAQLAIGRLHRERKRWEASEKALVTARDQFEEDLDRRGRARAWLELARTHFARGADADGRKALVESLKADDGFPDAYFFLGRLYAGNRRTRSEARDALNTYLKLAPTGEYRDEASRLLRGL